MLKQLQEQIDPEVYRKIERTFVFLAANKNAKCKNVMQYYMTEASFKAAIPDVIGHSNVIVVNRLFEALSSRVASYQADKPGGMNFLEFLH